MAVVITIFLIVGYFIFNEVFVSSSIKRGKSIMLLIIDLLILMVIWISIEEVIARHLSSIIGNPQLAAFVIICLLAAFAGYKYRMFANKE